MTETEAIVSGIAFGAILAWAGWFAWQLIRLVVRLHVPRARTNYRIRVFPTTARDLPWRYEVDRLDGLTTRINSGGARTRTAAWYNARRHARFDARVRRRDSYTKDVSL